MGVITYATNDWLSTDLTRLHDIAEAVGLHGPYDLDNPAHMGMACADLLIPADKRPAITTSLAPSPFTVAHPRR